MTRIFNGTRRSFLGLGLTALACATTKPTLAMVPRLRSGTRVLSFHNLHTDERLHVAYWHDGLYDRAACAKINHLLRDHYSGDVHPMDVRLMDLLVDLRHRLDTDTPIEVISGYRAPRTNLMLASASDSVAKHSYHTRGMAIDLRLPGTPLARVYHTALAMRRGGVGFYPDSQFVHVDVGPIRTW